MKDNIFHLPGRNIGFVWQKNRSLPFVCIITIRKCQPIW